MTISDVVELLVAEAANLEPAHQAELEAMLVTPYQVPVESHPGETVVVVAEHRGRVLYWSDIEEGWELAPLTSKGGIAKRGCSQYKLSHIMHQTFGPAESA